MKFYCLHVICTWLNEIMKCFGTNITRQRLLLGVVLGGAWSHSLCSRTRGCSLGLALGFSPPSFFVNVNRFLGGLMTRRGSSSGISGSWSGPRPKIPKGSGDPKQILDLIWFRGYAVFLNKFFKGNQWWPTNQENIS